MAVVLAPGQLLLRLRGASRAVVLGAVAAAAARHAPAHLGSVFLLQRRALPDEEEEQVDADHHAVAQQALAPTAEGSTSVLASSAAVRDLSKEALGRPCNTSSTQELRVQVMSSMENSTVDDHSCLQDTKAVRLAEKSGEIWEVPCKLTNADSHQVAASADSDGLVIPVFLKYASGELTLSVNPNQPSQHLMHLYEQKTRMKLDGQYFVYGRKTLEPDYTLLFYGLERNTTVHVCGRLLGGKITTLKQYVDDNINKFTVEVGLPNKETSLQMTEKGCQFLSSWVKCFTTAFSRRQSWNGDFTLEDFKYSEGHIRYRKLPKGPCLPVSMANDLNLITESLENIFSQGKPELISKYPPYLEQFINFTKHLASQLSATKHELTSEDKLFLETHVCCMTSYARRRLIFELFRKYEGLYINEASDWKKAIDSASCTITWKTDLPAKAQFFQECIDKATIKGVKYVKSRTSAFVFIKDIVLHAADHQTQNATTPKLDDGIELMIPAYLEDFLPTIILNLIKEKVDIRAELLEAVKCACRICDSSY